MMELVFILLLSLNLVIQFWTSRGWGVVDVNYAGSTGFGRDYRNRLKHSWGEADVFDCSHAAIELVNQGTNFLCEPNNLNKAYNKRKIITVFEPHRYSRVMSLKKAFSKSFLQSDLVLICPLYAAGEKRNLNFNLFNFAKLISKNSKTQVVLVKNQKELSNYFKKNLISDEIIIGMGAGSISQWMRELRFSL